MKKHRTMVLLSAALSAALFARTAHAARSSKAAFLPIALLAALFALGGCSGPSGQPGGEAPPPAEAPAPAENGPSDTAGSGSTDSGDAPQADGASATLLYQGHGSLRITTAEGKVIYVDPYAGDGYDLPADLILVTHQHSDHNKVGLIKSRNPECVTITEKEALKDGERQSFDLGFARVEATEAGNKNHDPKECVGFIITLSDGLQIYISGDTSKTAQMETFAARGLDYAFLCCDGVYNMDMDEASECAALIGARHSIPYHIKPGELFDAERAGLFEAEGRLILAPGEELALT